MLSKMGPPGVMEKHLACGNSRRKENVDKQKTIDKSEESLAKSPLAKNCSSSNWEKFRSVVNQQGSGRKHVKHQRSHPGKTWAPSNKAPRMVPPPFQNWAEKGHQVAVNGVDSEANEKLTKQIAMDCEMVGIGDGTESMLARVSLVNRHGVCVYDKYVTPREKIQDYRTAVSGIRPHHLADGQDFKIVQTEVSEILRGRLLIGHALKNDLSVLFLSHPKRHLRDTSRYKPFRKVTMGNTPSLKKLAAELLGVDIQNGEHNSIEDARAAMQLYVLYKNQWEQDVYSRS